MPLRGGHTHRYIAAACPQQQDTRIGPLVRMNFVDECRLAATFQDVSNSVYMESQQHPPFLTMFGLVLKPKQASAVAIHHPLHVKRKC